MENYSKASLNCLAGWAEKNYLTNEESKHKTDLIFFTARQKNLCCVKEAIIGRPIEEDIL